jgi:hypothetical protein
MKFFLKCDEAVHVCDKCQYNEASFLEKFLLKIHILMCKLCHSHTQQNSKLTEIIKSANIKTLQAEEKEVLRIRIQQEIKNGQQS